MCNLSTQIRELRTARHWTQQQLAAASRVHYNTIINFENDKRSPSAETLSLLLGAMGYELTIKRKEAAL